MKQRQAAFLIVTFAMAACASDKKGFETNSLPVPEHGTLQIRTPNGWSFARKGAINPSGPRSAALRSENGDISVQFTMFWDGFGPEQLKPNGDKMAEMVKAIAELQYAPGSVEKKVVIEKFKGSEASGSFARFTDAEWAGKKTPPGEFSNVAVGMVRCGDLWGNFTILTNDKDGPHFKAAMAVVESLSKTKP